MKVSASASSPRPLCPWANKTRYALNEGLYTQCRLRWGVVRLMVNVEWVRLDKPNGGGFLNAPVEQSSGETQQA